MIKQAIVDSGIWIASRAEDSESKKAINILEKFSNSQIGEIYITNYILMESVNFLLRKKHFNIALEVYNYLTKTDRIKLIHVDEITSIRIKELFEKYKTLSIADCSIIALAENYNIETIFSFDSDFDKVKNLIRKESL